MNKILVSIKDNELVIRTYLLTILFLSSITFTNAQEKKDEHNEELEEHDHHDEHDHHNFKKCFIGIHGAVLFQNMSFLEKEERFENLKGSETNWNSTASIPMFAVAMGYKFSEKTDFLGKIEFEYGGFGGHQHVHTHGEEAHAELEKSGAVTVERVYITHKFSENFNLRVGHMPIPMGQVYLAHEPTAYMASISAKADSKVIPREWIETGVSILGHISENFKYEVMCLSGLDADYFLPRDFIYGGKQSKFEKIYFSSPAFIGRLDYKIHDLNLGLVGYWNKTDKNAQDQKHIGRDIKISLLELDARYRTNKLHFLSNIIWGNATNTEKLEHPIAEQALSASAEFGYNLNCNESIFSNHENALWLFGRVDYGDPMLKMPTGYKADIRSEELSFTGGINFFLNESIALKADYEYNIVGDKSINDEQIISFSVAYNFMPYKK